MADKTVAPGATYEIFEEWAETGQTLGARVLDNAGATTVARVTGFVEYPAGSGDYYRGGNIAPTVAGEYTIFIDDDGGTGAIGNTSSQSLLVTSSALVPSSPSGRDLCTLAEVKTYIPGYVTDTDTDNLLQRLITAESLTIHNETRREFVVIGTNPQSRTFDFTDYDLSTSILPIGDMASAPTSIVTTTIDGSAVQTVPSLSVFGTPRIRQAHEPITSLWFPAGTTVPATLGAGYVFTVTGTFGFPSIPADVREACCKRVVVRYLTDVANAGTDFSDAIDNVNIGGLLGSARDALDQYRVPTVA